MIWMKIYIMFFNVKRQDISIKSCKRWMKAFYEYICNVSSTSYDFPYKWNVLKGFTDCNIHLIEKKIKVSAPTVICVVRNEVERLGVFLDHYRNMGIRNFAIIDNNSKDGTLEFLKKQNDVDIFLIKDRFETRIKMGWINRVISYYGLNNWYIIADADELLVWQGMEKYNIQKILKFFDSKNITRLRALMIDMYPKEINWTLGEKFADIYPRCRYFDKSTYYFKEAEEVYLICGGPRKRKLGIELWLTKYPVFKLNNYEILSNPHAIFPYENNKFKCYFALKHYKFMTREDIIKMKKYARKGNYAGGSAEYKLYKEVMNEETEIFNFYYENSSEYITSDSLGEVDVIDKLPLFREESI